MIVQATHLEGDEEVVGGEVFKAPLFTPSGGFSRFDYSFKTGKRIITEISRSKGVGAEPWHEEGFL
jgi:hypothetical protein